MTPTHGWVYLVQSEDTGLVKIGFTRNLRARMTNLRNQNAGPVKLIGLMARSTRADEKAAQELFGKKWDHGEWFVLDDKCWEFFTRMK